MPSADKLIVIIGITGVQGSSVYDKFKDEPGWRIRGISRSPEKHQHLLADNVELVRADLDDEESLKKAFDGAHAIFSVTDFWQFPMLPSTFERAEKEGKGPNEIAMELEIQQGKKIIHAAASQVGKNLERFVVSTLSDSAKWSKGAITKNCHFDGKAKYTEYLKEQYPDLAAKSSYLYIGIYTSNWKMMPLLHPRKQSDGSFIIPGMVPGDGKKVPWLDPKADAGHFVKSLILHNPAGVSMLGYSQALNEEEFAQVWGKVNGVKARSEYLGYDEFVKNGVPEWLAQEAHESGRYQAYFGHAGGDLEVKDPWELGFDAGILRTVEEALKAEDFSSVL